MASYANKAAQAEAILGDMKEHAKKMGRVTGKAMREPSRKEANLYAAMGGSPESLDTYAGKDPKGAREFGRVHSDSRPDDGGDYSWEYQGMTQLGRQASGRDGTALGLGSPATGIWKKVTKPAAPQQEKAEEPYVPQPAKPFDPNPGQQADNVRGSYFAGFDNPAFSPHLDAKRDDFYSNLVGSADKRSRYIQAKLPEAMRADAMQSISEFSQATGNAVAGMRSKAVDVSSVFDPDKRFAGDSLYDKLRKDLRKAGNVA